MRFLDLAYVVALRIRGDFTDAELAAACFKRYGGNEETYRKRCHELRQRHRRKLIPVSRRRCTKTGKTATAYKVVPLNKRK